MTEPIVSDSIKTLVPKWEYKGIQYTGQPIDELNRQLALVPTAVPTVAIFDGERLYIDHWSCSEVSLDVGDWVVFEPQSNGFYLSSISTNSAVAEYYTIN